MNLQLKFSRQYQPFMHYYKSNDGGIKLCRNATHRVLFPTEKSLPIEFTITIIPRRFFGRFKIVGWDLIRDRSNGFWFTLRSEGMSYLEQKNIKTFDVRIDTIRYEV